MFVFDIVIIDSTNIVPLDDKIDWVLYSGLVRNIFIVMKKTTCKDLRGACDAEITGETPEEMGENSKKHVMEMMSAGDEAHKVAVQEMMQLSKEDQQKWYEEFKSGFDALQDV